MVTKHTNQTQSTINSSVWRSGRYLRSYDNRVLSPAEVQIFVRYGTALSGRVLDLGCGAGRVLSYLVMVGADAHGLDISPAMVERCRRNVPNASVTVGDVATLTSHVAGRFDAVLAPDNLLDVFEDRERRQALAQIREVLEPNGLLIFSSHDLAYADSPPADAGADQRITLRKLVERTPADIANSIAGRLLAVRNRRRLSPLQERHADHAIINDFPHYYSLLHYYIRRDDQERQLKEVGFDLVECLDSEGCSVGPGGTGPRDYLYYIARPS
jgi:SAM-dependent methyltransferase